MIRLEQFTKKLRELGYKYKDQTLRVQIYRKGGSTHRVTVARKDHLDDGYVRSTLKQCGCKEAEIETFIGQCKS